MKRYIFFLTLVLIFFSFQRIMSMDYSEGMKSINSIEKWVNDNELLKSHNKLINMLDFQVYPFIHIDDDTALLPYVFELYISKRIVKKEPNIEVIVNCKSKNNIWYDFSQYNFTISFKNNTQAKIPDNILSQIQANLNNGLSSYATLNDFLTKFPDLFYNSLNDLLSKLIIAEIDKIKSSLPTGQYDNILITINSFEDTNRAAFLNDIKQNLNVNSESLSQNLGKISPEILDAWKKVNEIGNSESIRKNAFALQTFTADALSGISWQSALEEAIQVSGLNAPDWSQVNSFYNRIVNFDKKAISKYTLSNLKIGGNLLDAYVPGQKIVIRKALDLDNISEVSWRTICSEFNMKFKVGSSISDSRLSGTLSGKYYIEIPSGNAASKNLASFRNIAKNEYGIEDIIYLEE